MSETFSATTIDQIAKQLNEPAWLTQARQRAWAKHRELSWPHPSDDIWRRTDISQLDPTHGFSLASPALLQSVVLKEHQVTELTRPLGDEQLFVRINGAWLLHEAPHDIVVDEFTRAVQQTPEPLRHVIEADGLSDAEQKLTSLNAAFHHDGLVVQVPVDYSSNRPLRLVRLYSVAAKHAIFPLTIITVGAGSSVTLIDEYVSVSQNRTEGDPPHLVNGRIELLLEPDAHVHYVRLQRWGAQAREFLLQRATLARGATLTMANITLGAALSKAHIVTKLIGAQASTQLSGFVFGHRTQHIDQHTLQDHRAPRTTSDLQFRAALQDASRMIYTGLIRIAKEAQQTTAYQANHNLLLSEQARAETIPMLEILADDVQCKHGASTGPIDDEQAFYLRSRGIPHKLAQRLIVMGFVEPMIQQVPFAPLQQRLREEIEGVLHS